MWYYHKDKRSVEQTESRNKPFHYSQLIFDKGAKTIQQGKNSFLPHTKYQEREYTKAKEFQKNIYFCFIDYAKAFDCVDHKKLENSERDGNTRPPDLPLEKSVCRSGSNSQNWTWSNRLVTNQEKEYVKAVYCHPAYLTYMQSTSCEMLAKENEKAGLRFHIQKTKIMTSGPITSNKQIGKQWKQ